MHIVVVYDSHFGNTERIARAIAERLGRHGDVRVASIQGGPHTAPGALDLLVVGAPTQGHGVSPAMRRWLDGLRQVAGVHAAAFDTRFAKPRWLTGSAARFVAGHLGRLGFRLVRDPESFYVAHTHGPLLDGELERAARWADTLADQHIPEAAGAGV